VQSVRLTLTGDDARLDVTVRRRDLMKLWRRPVPLAACRP
jgi:hypothetical protein